MSEPKLDPRSMAPRTAEDVATRQPSYRSRGSKLVSISPGMAIPALLAMADYAKRPTQEPETDKTIVE